MRSAAFVRALAIGFTLGPAAVAACTSGSPSVPTANGGDRPGGGGNAATPISDGGPGTTVVTMDAGDGSLTVVDAGNGCSILVESPPLLSRDHVPIGTPVTYDSNPPSSGPHYPIWAAYQEYDAPVDRRYYVHNLEHGGVVFAYNAALLGALGDAGAGDAGEARDGGVEAARTAILEELRAARDAIPTDAFCAAQYDGGANPRVRTVITPDPLLDVPIAAAAWGWTYKATCVDLKSLTEFAIAHYARAPEMECGDGTTTFQ